MYIYNFEVMHEIFLQFYILKHTHAHLLIHTKVHLYSLIYSVLFITVLGYSSLMHMSIMIVLVYLCAMVHFVSLSTAFFEGTKYIKINLNINLMGKRGKEGIDKMKRKIFSLKVKGKNLNFCAVLAV